MTRSEFLEATTLVLDLVHHLDEMGSPAKNPFARSTLESFSPVEQNQLDKRFEQAIKLLRHNKLLGHKLATEMELRLPVNLLDIHALCRAADRALNAPHLKGLKLTTDDWQLRRDQIHELLSNGQEMNQLYNARREQLIEQAWGINLLTVRQIWTTTGKRWWRFLSGNFRKAKQELQGLLIGELPKDSDECIQLIDDIMKYQSLEKSFTQNERLGSTLFGAQWQGKNSDWEVLQTLSNWIIEIYHEVGKGDIPKGLLRFLEGGNDLEGWSEKLKELQKSSSSFNRLIEEITSKLAIVFKGDGDTNNLSFDLLTEELQLWQSQIDSLYQMTRYNSLRKKLKVNGLEQIDALAFNWNLEPKLLLTTLKLSWYGGLVNEAYLIDTIKMIAYRAETAMANCLRDFMPHQGEARKVLQTLYQTEADIIPDYKKQTLTIQLHHMANEAMDKVIHKICDELNATETRFPRTNLRLILKVGTS